ncbi:unnamed protein product [Lampetra fluviatilis]
MVMLASKRESNSDFYAVSTSSTPPTHLVPSSPTPRLSAVGTSLLRCTLAAPSPESESLVAPRFVVKAGDSSEEDLSKEDSSPPRRRTKHEGTHDAL